LFSLYLPHSIAVPCCSLVTWYSEPSGPVFWTLQVWFVIFYHHYIIKSFSLSTNLARFGECGGWGQQPSCFWPEIPVLTTKHKVQDHYHDGEISLQFTISHRCHRTSVYMLIPLSLWDELQIHNSINIINRLFTFENLLNGCILLNVSSPYTSFNMFKLL
jgi:hypothetical protein